MVKTRSGIGFRQKGVIYTGIRRRDGTRWAKALAKVAPEVPITLGWAKSISLQLQARYDAGTWDPDAEETTGAKPRPGAPLTFYEHVHEFTSRQTYESAPNELRAVERYLKGCPIANLPVSEVRVRHGIETLTYLKAIPSERGGTLGRSPVMSVFNVCERALDELAASEVLPANPFRHDLVHKQLPAKAEKVPGARARWRFPVGHIVLLTTAEEIPEDRRALYALVFFTGCRPGEARALRFYDLEFDVRPLGRVNIARAIKSVSKREGPTKTMVVKECPMLPQLATILREWKASGWERTMGRAPRASDLVIPSVRGRKRGEPRNQSTANRTFKDDQAAVGIETPQHMYAARHTLVRLLRDSDARREVVRWATHAKPSSTYDGYADAPPWHVLCAEFAKLVPVLAATPDPSSEPSPVIRSVIRSGGGGENDNDSAVEVAEAQRNRTSRPQRKAACPPVLKTGPVTRSRRASAASVVRASSSCAPKIVARRPRQPVGALEPWPEC